MAGKTVIPIAAAADIVVARRSGRELAQRNGLIGADSTLVATVISELARNIVLYANRGEIALEDAANGGRRGIVIISTDQGPGIADVERAVSGGYSTSGSLGLGLSGVRQIADQFSIDSAPGQGTTVTATIWRCDGNQP